MPKWIPTEEWKGQDAYVVGGGPSLESFDWSLLRGRQTVGCNSAYSLGAGIVKLVVFGDAEWWTRIGRQELPAYGGRVVGCAPDLKDDETPWLLQCDRVDSDGLSAVPGKLAFNRNTGALALNLALQMGAARVFLLGFDMRADDPDRPNWHRIRYAPGARDVYGRFREAFGRVAEELSRKFPGRQVVNLTEGSDLEHFPKASLLDHFGVARPRKAVTRARAAR